MTALSKELREKSATIAMQARELFADESKAAEVAAMLAEHDALEARIAQAEKLEAIEKEMASVDESRRPQESRGRASKEEIATRHAAAFAEMLRTDDRYLSAETRGALAGLETRDGQVVGTPGAGGYLVPTSLANEIIVAQKFYNAMNPDNVTWFSTSTGNNLTFVQRDSTSATARIPGETNAVITNAVTYTDVVLGSYLIDPDHYKASYELVQDSAFDIEGDIKDHMGEAMGRKLNAYLTTGTGTGQPTGILTAVGTPSLASAANSTTVAISDFINLEAQVDIAYRSNPKTAYMFNDSIRLAGRLLLDTQGRPIWTPALAAGDLPTLNGYRYIVNPDMPNKATGNVFAVFGDFSKFRVRTAGGIVFQKFNELYAGTRQVGYGMYQRVDSNLMDLRAVKGIKGA